MTNNNYCVILAGGKGRRLWPCSRMAKPKQFLDFFGVGRTQLQQTFDRFTHIMPSDNILVCTNHDYAPLVREQLPDLPEENLIVEPLNRGTAPAVAWSNMRVFRRNPDANIIVSPSDQIMLDEEAFRRNIDEALYFVTHHDNLLTLGVVPTRPEPGYGYIQKGDLIPPTRAAVARISHVQSFVEKPERQFAQMFMDSGEFLWNTGLLLASSRFLSQCFIRLFPDVLNRFENFLSTFTIEQEMAFINRHYPEYPYLSIDRGVLERCDDVCVMQCDFGWADLGTWHSLYELLQRGEDDNVVVNSEVILEGSSNNVIKLPKDRLAVISGLDGYIVAESGNVLLICRKSDSSTLVKKYVNEILIKYGEDFV